MLRHGAGVIIRKSMNVVGYSVEASLNNDIAGGMLSEEKQSNCSNK